MVALLWSSKPRRIRLIRNTRSALDVLFTSSALPQKPLLIMWRSSKLTTSMGGYCMKCKCGCIESIKWSKTPGLELLKVIIMCNQPSTQCTWLIDTPIPKEKQNTLANFIFSFRLQQILTGLVFKSLSFKNAVWLIVLLLLSCNNLLFCSHTLTLQQKTPVIKRGQN